MSSPVLLLPGFCNSGPEHWQSLWENDYPEFKRVVQRDWKRPVCEDWVDVLECIVRQYGPSAVVVAHSLGCLTVAHWAMKQHSPIKAALLVAVPDPENPNFPETASGFSPLPAEHFDFPCILVASTDDPYASLAHSRKCASAWGNRLVNIGAAGHINADSGLGMWQDGYALLQELRD
jgi:predicted alpha/beta hydrolase family esterase